MDLSVEATESYDYHLPIDKIAQTPTKQRDAARLLVDARNKISDRCIYDLPDLLSPQDLLVLNNTRVQKARLHLHKKTGGKVEVLALAPADKSSGKLDSKESNSNESKCWAALIKSNRPVPSNSYLYAENRPKTKNYSPDNVDALEPVLEVGEPTSPNSAERYIYPAGNYTDIHKLLQDLGEIPLPPYIHTPLDNPERYQTVFCAANAQPSSAAAPTAGLHLSQELLEKIHSKNIQVAELELSVGLATFSPIKTEAIGDHCMHTESYRISPETLELCKATKAAGRNILAVGTTVVRALETAFQTGELSGQTKLFIRPGFQFQAVDKMLTNFHTPRSTLLVLLAAFIGNRWRDLYEHALKHQYRFLSFGDAMLVERLSPNEPPSL